MGLDMYAYTCSAESAGDSQVDFDMEKLTNLNRYFAYWRKFNNLHGWMHSLYNSKGGKDPDFNCSTVRLMPEDLDKLESLSKLKVMPPTNGFFFGASEEFTDDDRDEVLKFISNARDAIQDGRAVIYDSWW